MLKNVVCFCFVKMCVMFRYFIVIEKYVDVDVGICEIFIVIILNC